MRLGDARRGKAGPTSLRSSEALRGPEEELIGSPNELLTPEVRRQLLEIKRGYEGGMMGDRIPPYLSFLAAARRCWPELKDELVVANQFAMDARSRSPEAMRNMLNSASEGNDRAIVLYARNLTHLSDMAFIQPDELRQLKEYQRNLLLLLQSELRMERYGYAFKLASVLRLGIPESRPELDEFLQAASADITKFVLRHRAWIIGGWAKLLIPGFTLDVPKDELARSLRQTESEFSQLIAESNFGETHRLDGAMGMIFAIGVLSADEAKLQPDGTILYIFPKRKQVQPELPERPLNI